MAVAGARRRTEHVFFFGMASLLAVYVLLGFWKSYLGAGLILAPLPSLLVHVHAILFVGWIALLLGQSALISAGNLALHRRLGAIMGWWAAAIVIVGPVTTVIALRRPDSGVNAVVFAGDLGQSIAFAILIRAGLVHRRDASAHKRLMLLATAAIMAPAIVRWPFDFILGGPPFGLVVFYMLPPLLLVAYDLAMRGHVHRATGLGLGLMTFAVASFLVLPALPGWLAISRWIQRV